jgi:hypothetical protein
MPTVAAYTTKEDHTVLFIAEQTLGLAITCFPYFFKDFLIKLKVVRT